MRVHLMAAAILVGAVIGAGIGLLGVAVVGCDPDSNCHDAAGQTVALLGSSIAIGALVGLLVGASEPSHGPVPTD